MKKTTFILMTTTLLPIFTYADIAPEPIYSKGISPKAETKVQMVSELVTVDLYKDYAIVTAEFNMLNRGEDSILEVGFPNGGSSLYSSFRLTDFSVTIDGAPCTYETKENTIRPNGSYRLTGEIMNADYQEWLVWDVTFNKAESKKIVVSYRQPSGAVYSPGMLEKGYFLYILETGAGWYNGIDQATVIVNLKDGLTTNHIINAAPPGNYTMSDDSIRWDFQNLEPSRKDNIFINFNRYSDYSELVEKHGGENIDSWGGAWSLAYACNNAGQYELAEKILERHVREPNNFDKSTQSIYHDRDPESRKSNEFYEQQRRDEKKYEQIALHKQLVMARYQLYLKNKNKTNEENLKQALDGLKAWAVLYLDNSEQVNNLFPENDYGETSYQWLLSEYLMDDVSIANPYHAPEIFQSRWNDALEAAIQGKPKVRLVEQHVSIDFYKDRRDVTAEYSLKNTGPGTTVVIKLEDLAGDYLLSDLFADFRLYINDAAVLIDSCPTPPADDDWNQSHWNPAWNVSLGEMGDKNIRVTYSVPYDSKRAQDIGDLLDERHYQYLLGRNADWNGTIERASIVIDLKDMTTEHLSSISPPPFVKSENRLTWKFEDWEPAERGSAGNRVEFYYTCHKENADDVDKQKDEQLSD